jgi:folylpolyglutamate synthase/dihydropteroate synthase
MADKDVAGIAAALATAAALEGARIVATQVGLPRALPAEELAATWTRAMSAAGVDSTVEAIPDVGRALDRSVALAAGPIVVAGSLYLVGEARRRWVDDPDLRDPEMIPA